MIDLSQLPPPDIIETLDYEQLLAANTALLLEQYPEEERTAVAERLALESDPRTKLLQQLSYRELILRQRINEAARACMLAYSSGTDLDNLTAVFDVQRSLIAAGDPTANPPTSDEWESDASLRRRTQLAAESYTSCGTFEAYRFHALGVPGVEEASVTRPQPGIVRVLILPDAAYPDSVASLLTAVQQHLSSRKLRSVNDVVEVVQAGMRTFNVTAKLVLRAGPSSAAVVQAAHTAVQDYAVSIRQLGYDVTRSGLYAALHQAGVKKVELLEPAVDIPCDLTEVAILGQISLTTEVTDDD